MVLLVFLPFFACLLSLNRQIEGGVATESPETHHSLLEAVYVSQINCQLSSRSLVVS